MGNKTGSGDSGFVKGCVNRSSGEQRGGPGPLSGRGDRPYEKGEGQGQGHVGR